MAKNKLAELKYKDEYIFFQGRTAYKINPDKMCPYQRWQQQKRDDWMAGYLYEQRIAIQNDIKQHD